MRHDKEAYVTTWMSHDNSEFWLLWLKKTFPKARILTISYDSSIKKTKEYGRLDMYCAGENLLSDLTSDSVRVGKVGCPVVLVGHCLGGLVLKELCLSAGWMLARQGHKMLGIQQICDFFSNLRGMIFYGTPQSVVPSGMRWKRYSCGSRSLCQVIHGQIYSVAADHFKICKPRAESSSAFTKLRDFLHEIHHDGLLRAKLKSSQDYYVDLEGRGEEVQRMLAQQDAQTVYITGRSGIGKSALAEQVFRNNSDTFPNKCIVHLDSLERQSNHTDHVLREQVLEKLQDALKGLDQGLNIYDRFNVHHYLKGNKILMILDNVESQCQLDALDRASWLEGSRLLVTTTNSRLVSGSPSNTCAVPLLNETESKEMFRHYAFGDGVGPEAVQDLIEQVIWECDNFPLSLKVMGRFLRTQKIHDRCLWTTLIKKLQNAEEVDGGGCYDYRIWSRLMPSFEALERREQETFLDAALVFHGSPLNFVNKYIWSECRGGSAWDNLKELFVVSVSYDGKIKMHKQLRDVARRIACPPFTPIESWRRILASDVANELITKLQRDVETRSLELHVQANKRIELRNMTSVQFVNLEYLILDGGEMTTGCLQLPRSLVYLRWHDGLFDDCPLNFSCTEDLRVLDLQDCKAMKCLPQNVVTAKKLLCLELKGCQALTQLPLEIFESRNLKHLGLSGTALTKLPSKLGKLTRIPKSICHVKMLVSLDIIFTKVNLLPTSFGNLSSLTQLRANGTPLRSLPDSTGRLQNLECLELSDKYLKSLPESLGNAQGLKMLNLDGARNLEVLPHSICNLKLLRTLRLRCTCLSLLPEGIGGLQQLYELDLAETRLEGLPESLGDIATLRHLKLYSTSLQILPESICKLRNLSSLDLSDTKIRSLPMAFGELSMLSSLNLRRSRVTSLPETFKSLSWLYTFGVSLSICGRTRKFWRKNTLYMF